MIAATGWLPHTTRAALTRLRQAGHVLDKAKRETGGTVYHIAKPANAEGGSVLCGHLRVPGQARGSGEAGVLGRHRGVPVREAVLRRASSAGRSFGRRSRREPILRSPTRKHAFIGRDGGAKPRQRPRLAGQRPQSAGVLPSKILKTREFSALHRSGRFPKNAWWS